MRIERKKRMVRVRSRERTREIELERVTRVRTDLYGEYRVEDLLTEHLCAHPIVFSIFQDIGEIVVRWTSASGET